MAGAGAKAGAAHAATVHERVVGAVRQVRLRLHLSRD